MENETERALHKFGFHTLADRLQYSVDITESRFSDLEHRINDAMCENQHAVYNVKMEQDNILIRLSSLDEASNKQDAGQKNGYAKPGSIVSSSKVTPGKVNEEQSSFKRRLKIHGWSPYRADSQLQLSTVEAHELIQQIKAIVPDIIKSYIEFQRPFSRNFQIMIRLPNCNSADTAFRIRAELQEALEGASITARGVELKVGV